jgi:O-antigen/teichoic acid export membrane protein
MARRALSVRFGRMIRGEGFAGNAALLSGASLIGQLITLAVYPVLTRLYSPEAFGVAASVYFFYSVLSVVASGMGESAVLVARSSSQAIAVARWVIQRALVVLSFSQIVLVGMVSAGFFDSFEPTLRYVLLLAPLLAGLSVLFSVFSEYAVREQLFRGLASARLVQSSSVVAFRTLIGLSAHLSGGLVLGEVLGKMVSVLVVFRHVGAYFKAAFLKTSRHQIRRIRRRYRRMSRHGTLDSLINVTGGSVHVPIIAGAFGVKELGFVAVVSSALFLPVTIVSSAVKDVFRQRAALEVKNGGCCRRLYLRTLMPVAVCAIVAFSGAVFIMPHLLPWVLGPGWEPVVTYTAILMPMFAFNFIAMSLNGIFAVVERLDVSVLWQVANLGLTVLALAAAINLYGDVASALVFMSAAKVMGYALHMVLSYYFARVKS